MTLMSSEEHNWRVGLTFRTVDRSHERYYENSKCLAWHPAGYGNIFDSMGVMVLESPTGSVFLSGASLWTTV